MSSRVESPTVDVSVASPDVSIDGLYRRYGGLVREYVARTFGAGPPEPDDVAQAAFEHLAARNLAEIQNPRAFLLRSARNFVIDHHRRQTVRRSYASSVLATDEDIFHVDPERALVSKERLDLLRQAIDTLDPRRKEVLILNRVYGMSCAEIGKRLNRSSSLVKLLVAEALMHCHAVLRKADGDDGR